MNDMQDLRTELVAGESVVRRPARALIGWTSRQEAVSMLLGRNPGPTDDVSTLMEAADKSAQAVAGRPKYQPSIRQSPMTHSPRRWPK